MHTEAPPGASVLVVARGRGRVHVADRAVPALSQRMIGQIVRPHVVVNVLAGPAEDGVHLDDVSLELDFFQTGAKCRLSASQPREPPPRRELAERAIHRFDFVDPLVALEVSLATLPELAVERLLSGGRHLRSIYAKIEVEASSELLGESIRFGKQVASVEQDHANARNDSVNQMEHHGRVRTEARRENEVVAESVSSPFENLF